MSVAKRRVAPLVMLIGACLIAGLVWSRMFVTSVAGAVVLSVVAGAAVSFACARARVPGPATAIVSIALACPVAAWFANGSAGSVGRVLTSWPSALPETLSLRIPLDDQGPPLILVVGACWIAGALSVELYLRTKGRLSPMLPSLGLLTGALLLASPSEAGAFATACGFLVLLLLYLALDRPQAVSSESTPVSLTTRVMSLRPLFVGVVGSALVAAAVGGLVPDSNGPDLHDGGPIDPRDLPSPLFLLASELALEEPEERFNVVNRGGEAAAYLVLAAVDDYDGVDWQVSREFVPVGSHAPNRSSSDESSVVAEITVSDYADVWVPHVGAVKHIDVSDMVADSDRSTLVTASPFETGDRFEASGALVKEPGSGLDGSAADDEVDPRYLALPSAPQLPEKGDTVLGGNRQCRLADITDAAAQWVNLTDDGPDAKAAALLALQQRLRDGFAFDSGAPYRHSVSDLCRSLGFGPFASSAGDEKPAAQSEQFATAMVLMARSLGIPARIVVGYKIPDAATGEPVAVMSSDARAWVEAHIPGAGWITYDPTPQSAGDAESTVPKVNPRRPTPPPIVSTTIPPGGTTTTTTSIPDESTGPGVPGTGNGGGDGGLSAATKATAGAGGLSLLVMVACAVIGLLKLRRRAARRSASHSNERARGAWFELIDVLRDSSISIEPSFTPMEIAAAAAEQSGEPELLPLVQRLAQVGSEAMYSRRELSDAVADEAWDLLERVELTLSGARTPGRLGRRLSLRSLRTTGAW